MKKELHDCLIIGTALFAMFFGAGNLIFPPQLGFLTGVDWLTAFIAFAVTGIGIPILGIFSVEKAGGTVYHFASKVHPFFANIFGTIIMLGIGPLLALPRTAATTYEIGIRPFSDKINSFVSSLVFFSIVLLFSIKPSKVIDRIGKYLTPLLIFVLLCIIIRGTLFPIGPIIKQPAQNFFLKGFLEGYQTMDALAAMLFATIIIDTIAERGYKNKKIRFKINIISGSLAAFCLLFVYSGLMYVGATGTNIFPQDISRTTLLISLCEKLWGNLGKIILAFSIALACLTTAIGLTATAGHYFVKLFHNKVSYEAVVIVVTIFSCWLANYGVENIIRYSVPLLEILYPVCILLIVMNLLDDYIPSRYYYIGGTIGTMTISILQGLISARSVFNDFFSFIGVTSIKVDKFNVLLQKLPFAAIGLSWLIPAIICAVVFGFFGQYYKNNRRS